MHISFEGRLSIWLGVVALAGGGALAVRPDLAYVGYSLLAVAAAMALFLVWHHLCGLLKLSWEGGSKRKMIALAGMLLSGVSLLGFAGAFYWPQGKKETVAPSSDIEAKEVNPTDTNKNRKNIKLNLDYRDHIGDLATDIPTDFYFINETDRNYTIKSATLIEKLVSDLGFRGSTEYAESCLVGPGDKGYLSPDFYESQIGIPSIPYVNMQDGSLMSHIGPTNVFVDDVPRATTYAVVPARGTVKISATFTIRGPSDERNVSVLCPVVRMLDESGLDVWALCRGRVRARTYEGGDAKRPRGILGSSARLTVPLFPYPDEKLCRLVRL